MSSLPPLLSAMASGRRAPPSARSEPERLQKVLARAGLASRREAEDWIRAGRLTVNGQSATLGVRVIAGDQIRLDGRLIRQRGPASGARAFLLHRSPGQPLRQPSEGDTNTDSGEPTASLERLPRKAGRRFVAVSPMPRIDGGLELVTADGELGATLQRRVRTLTNEFSVRIRGELGERELQGILGGELDSGAVLQVERCEAAGGEGSNRWYAFAGRGASGKDVRQLFERHGALVSRVLRTRLGTLMLDRHLPRGQFRELRSEEIESLLGASAGSRSSAR